MRVTLGCGLIAIGRTWGTTKSVPTESEAIHFLEKSYEHGIRFFDTAPSYGLSEERLGIFLRQLTKDQLEDVTIATKFGEHWDYTTNKPYVNHNYDSLRRSLHQSYERLGKIDILQLHKTSPEVLTANDTRRALEQAQILAPIVGASVSDTESALQVIDDVSFQWIQIPYNQTQTHFDNIIQKASRKKLIINRPFQMGAVLLASHNTVEPFRFILKQSFSGVILTGTSNPEHLKENIKSFESALNE